MRRENLFFCLAALAMVLEIFGLPGTRDSDLAHAAGGAALPPAAPVVAVYQPLDEQLEVFIVDATGALNVVWKDNDGAWKTPFPLTRAIFTIPSVSAIYYPTYQQLEVFVVDKNGILNVVWKDHNGAWHAPVGLTDPGFAPAGAPLAAVYQPPNEQLEVFVVGANGALNVVWKDNNGVWKRPPCSGGNCPGWQMLTITRGPSPLSPAAAISTNCTMTAGSGNTLAPPAAATVPVGFVSTTMATQVDHDRRRQITRG